MNVKKIKTLIIKYSKNPLAVFLVKGFLFFVAWNLLIFPFIFTPAFHNWVIYRLVDISVIVLGWFFQYVTGVGTEIFINSKHMVHIGIPCNGIDVMGVYACIILAFHAPWYHKLWMVIVGCIMVFFLNIIRICGLSALLFNHNIHAFDINHKYIFNTILYAVLLILFSIWSSKFGTKPVKTTN